MSIDTQSRSPTQVDTLRFDRTVVGILDSLGVGLLVADSDQRICYRNALAAAWLSDGDDLESTFAGTRFLGRFEGWILEFPRIIDQETTVRFQCALPVPGRTPPLLATIHCTPWRTDNSQHAEGVVILIEEMAEQTAVDERLEVSKRLASLGKLATRVAHELNNPLDGILRYINLAMRLVDDVPESKLRDYLAESRTGLMRMVQIIGDLLEFSRTTEGEFEQATINEIVEQAIRAHDSTANENRVVVAADFQTPDMPSIRGSRLYQVCCNLIKNAIEAMPDGGRLSVTTGVVNDEVVIRVADTGVGLSDPPDKVFEPFFTTKEPGKGTGIGLAICKDFIEDMKGTITASPCEDGGAVFTVRIPLSSCQQPSPLQRPARGKPWTA
jgi:signal transduction histidine kinase